jgi:hypothetical protein
LRYRLLKIGMIFDCEQSEKSETRHYRPALCAG